MFKDFFKRFSNQFLFLLLCSVVLPTFLVSAYSINRSSQTLMTLITKTMEVEGTQNAKTVNLLLDNIQADVLYLSKTPPIQGMIRAEANKGIDPLDKSTYQSWVKRLEIIFVSILESRSYYDKVRFLDENGNEIVRVNNQQNKTVIAAKSELENEKDNEYFQAALKLKPGEFYASPVNLTRTSNRIDYPHKLVIRYSTPIYNLQGKIQGVIVANVLMEEIFKLAQNEKLKQELGQDVIVVNPQGYYLSHPDPSKKWGFDLGHEEKLQKDYPSEISQKILSLDEGAILQDSDEILSYHPIFPDENNTKYPIITIYRTPKEVVFASVRHLQWFAVAISAVLSIIVLIVGWLIVRSLIQSISQLIGTIATFSNQISTNIDEQLRMSSRQANSVQEITLTMEELNNSSQKSAHQATSAATGGQQALTAVDHGNQAVETTLAEMKALKERGEIIAQQISHLSQQTHQIGNVADLVNDLANQTNMLALNAAVEAVRAGEQGKGFAVVAAEIRKLSEESKKSSQKIGVLVTEIQTAIESTVTASETGNKNIETGVAIAQKTSQVFADVASAMEQIVEQTQQISLNSQQQAIATQQVTSAMTHLTSDANESTRGVSQIKSGMEQLNQAANHLKEVI